MIEEILLPQIPTREEQFYMLKKIMMYLNVVISTENDCFEF